MTRVNGDRERWVKPMFVVSELSPLFLPDSFPHHPTLAAAATAKL